MINKQARRTWHRTPTCKSSVAGTVGKFLSLGAMATTEKKRKIVIGREESWLDAELLMVVSGCQLLLMAGKPSKSTIISVIYQPLTTHKYYQSLSIFIIGYYLLTVVDGC